MFTTLVDHLQRIVGKDKIKKVLYISQSSYRLEKLVFFFHKAVNFRFLLPLLYVG